MNATATAEVLDLTVHDWQNSRSAILKEVSRSATVGQAVAEAVRALQLPFATAYKALYDGRELPHGDTLGEAGIRPGEGVDLVPEISAGAESGFAAGGAR
jgi:hypothetical protein